MRNDIRREIQKSRRSTNRHSLYYPVMVLSMLALLSSLLLMFLNLDQIRAFNWRSVLTVGSVLFNLFVVFSLTTLLHRRLFSRLTEIQRHIDAINAGSLRGGEESDIDATSPHDRGGRDELTDIIDGIQALKKQLRERLEEQQELEKKRKVLLARISHDLRTPLTSITGYVEALQDGISPDEETYLATIHERADYMNRLIEDLSVYSKQELDELPIYMEFKRSDTLLENYFNNFFSNDTLKVSIHRPFVQTYLQVDVHRFRQILDNLIGNAMKYARTSVDITTTLRDGMFEVTVRDDGEGIPSEFFESIFDPFFMVNKVKDQALRGGTGLGLTIVKQLVERHGGCVRVHSQVNEGAAFTFALPIVRKPN